MFRMYHGRSGLLLGMMLYSCPVLGVQSKVVYGADDRVEASDERWTPRVQSWVRATAALFEDHQLVPAEDGSEHFELATEETEVEPPLCRGERFRNQPRLAFCSGFLVAPQVLATASHCLPYSDACEQTRIVFDYLMEGEGVSRIHRRQVFRCEGIVARSESPADWLLLQLDRPVVDRKPLRLRRRGRVSSQAKLMVIGHPDGMPMKVSAGGMIRDNSPESHFVASLDTYRGSSGSPVIRRKSGLVEGILVRGEEDWELDQEGDCHRTRVCRLDGCRGEDVQRSKEIQGFESLSLQSLR